MAHQATWHTSKPGFHLNGSFLHGIRPPSAETGLTIGIAAIIAVVVFLHLQGAVPVRPAETPGIRIEGTASPLIEAHVAEPPAAPLIDAPVAPLLAIAIPEPASVVDSGSAPPVISLPRVSTIRAVDLATLPALRNVSAQTGLTFDASLVTYGELAGAGDIALAPLLSGGSAGTLAIAVVGVNRDGPRVLALLTPYGASRSQLRAEFEGTTLVVTTATFGAEDPLCCPSLIKRTTYAWDGHSLRSTREVVASAASAKN